MRAFDWRVLLRVSRAGHPRTLRGHRRKRTDKNSRTSRPSFEHADKYTLALQKQSEGISSKDTSGIMRALSSFRLEFHGHKLSPALRQRKDKNSRASVVHSEIQIQTYSST